MYVKDAVELADIQSPNNFPFEIKLFWLKSFEENIWNTLFLTHEGAPDVKNTIEDEESELAIASPYDELYVLLLKMRIDEANNDSIRYANSRLLYNEALSNYRAYYNRTHMPIERATVRFF